MRSLTMLQNDFSEYYVSSATISVPRVDETFNGRSRMPARKRNVELTVSESGVTEINADSVEALALGFIYCHAECKSNGKL